jgi:hypothetical protein
MPIVASPDGLFDNEGTVTSPFSLDRGLQELANGENVLFLRGGTYVALRVSGWGEGVEKVPVGFAGVEQ